MAEPETGAEHPARGEREEGLGELAGSLAGVDRGVRVQPVLHPAVHMGFEGADDEGARGGQEQPDGDPAGPAGGHVEQDHEEAEEEQ